MDNPQGMDVHESAEQISKMGAELGRGESTLVKERSEVVGHEGEN